VTCHLLRAGYISSRFFRAVNLPGAVGIIATPRKKDPFECTVLYQRSVSRIFSAKSIKTDPTLSPAKDVKNKEQKSQTFVA